MQSKHPKPSARRHGRGGPWFLFAHGAGASSTSDWMSRWAKMLSELGPVERFDYPYMAAGRRRPDRLDRLLEAHRATLHSLRLQLGESCFLVGKSMGGRVGCHLALEEKVCGVICLGYPLVGGGKTRPVRDQVLLDLRRPACFIQGTRDRLCPLERLEPVLARRRAPSTLHVVPTGDHSLLATKRHLAAEQLSQEDLDRQALGTIASFVDRSLNATCDSVSQ